MKKTLVALMAAAVISIGAAQAATTSATPVSDWLNKTTSKITKTEQETAAKIKAREQKAEQRRIAREQALAKRQAAAEARRKEIESNIEAEKTFWRKLFTWDWE